MLPREFAKLVPEYELIQLVARQGPEAAAVINDIPMPQLNKLIDSGYVEHATPGLFRTLVADIVLGDVTVDELPLTKRADIYSKLSPFLQSQDRELYQVEEIGLDQLNPNASVEKWPSGFAPLDTVTGGLYQALMIVMAPTGVGKTSLMLAMADSLKRKYPECRVLFFEQEIPRVLMEARMAPLVRNGTAFDSNDRLITGGVTITDIVRRGMDWPNKDQFIFVDSPDAMSFGLSENRRGDLEEVYRQMVRLKDRCRLVVTSSQVRRADSNNITSSSVAESWAKAWYADMIVALTEQGPDQRKLKVTKNRFGPSQKELIFEFNMETLACGSVFDEATEWEDWSE